MYTWWAAEILENQILVSDNGIVTLYVPIVVEHSSECTIYYGVCNLNEHR